MTTESTDPSEPVSFKKFSNAVLPWIVLAGALILYVATLNHWVTASSLSVLAKISGWDWQKPVAAPLYFLLTLPIKWLPAGWQAVALNLFSAICATLTLGLLARSVALLPQDRTKEQRSREHDEFSLLSIRWAWIPPVVAVLLCAFQLTFWEHATAASGEMLDVLLFAYVIRCLLEFRLTEKQSWLTKFAFVYGLGMANSWAMVGYFPLFLVSLVWIRGFAFFNLRFIGRLVLWLLVGMLLYLLLPLIGVLTDSGVTFWEALKANVANQKNLTINNPFVGGLKFDFLTMALTSLVPMLLVGIRWTSDYADVSPIGTILTNWMFRLLHLTVLVFCVWVFFDYKFSPRVLGRGYIQFLSLYYLSALSVGYLCGYVLLVFGHEGERAWGKSRSGMRKVNKAIAFLVAIAALAMPFWLFYRSFASVRDLNGPELKQFARDVAKTLPKNAVVISDEPMRLNIMQAWQASEEQGGDRIFLNTQFFPKGRYHSFLKKRFPSEKESFVVTASPEDTIDSLTLILVLERLGKSRPLYYMHPSFGYYFERYYPRQHGLVYELKPFPENELFPPKLTEAEIDENEQFWNGITPSRFKRLNDLAEKMQSAAMLCGMYSSALNAWAVELQRHQQLKPAEDKFYIAWKLDPDNVIAQINGRYNVALQQGNAQPVQMDESLFKQLNNFRGLVGAVSYFGLIDEPGACLVLGQVLKGGGNLRQAAQQFRRVTQLLPDDVNGRLGFANVLLDLRQPEMALAEAKEIRTRAKDDAANYDLELLDLQGRALLVKGDFATAENLMMETLEENLKDENRYRLVFQFYIAAADSVFNDKPEVAKERYQKAIGILNQLAALRPDAQYGLNKAAILAKIGKTEEAIAELNHLLQTDPVNLNALLNRAIYRLQAGQLDAAKKDYNDLITLVPSAAYRAYFGLAQIAERKNDTREAIKNYRAYLEAAPRASLETQQVTAHLKQLESGKKP